MEMMNKMKGWGDKSMEMGSMEDSKEDSREMMGGRQGGEWFNMQNREDYEAYLKWCEENRARTADFQEQQRLLDQFKQREEAKREQEHNMMAEWKMWEKQMEMVASFDKLGYQIMEMKGKYYYTVTFEFMKFCKCSDFAGKVEAFFMGEPSNSDKFEMEMFEDLVDTIEDAQQRGNPNSIAQVLVNMSKGDQIKAFFAGLKEAMCDGAEAYVELVEAWEKQFKFLERLM